MQFIRRKNKASAYKKTPSLMHSFLSTLENV